MYYDGFCDTPNFDKKTTKKMELLKTKIKTNLYSEPKMNEIYTITGVEETKVNTEEGERDALRVTMKPEVDDGLAYSVLLWLSDNASSKSKLGSFLVALGNNTDTWKGQRIQILSWEDADREIEVVK